MQHYVLDRFGVGLLVRGCQHFLGPPTAGRGDVLHRMTLPLRRPLPPNRMPHPATLRDDLCQSIRPAKPVIEQMTIARLGRILRRREYRRLPNRRLRLLLTIADLAACTPETVGRAIQWGAKAAAVLRHRDGRTAKARLARRVLRGKHRRGPAVPSIRTGAGGGDAPGVLRL